MSIYRIQVLLVCTLNIAVLLVDTRIYVRMKIVSIFGRQKRKTITLTV